MKEPIGDVVPGHTMPKSHNQHIYNIGHTWGYIAILKDLLSGQHHDHSHKDKVTEPERQTHVPAIPKLFKSLDKKGLLKLTGLRIPIKFEMAKANIE